MQIEIRPSALKHGFNVDDIYSAFATHFYNKPFTGRQGIEVLVGFSSKGILLEVFFEKSDNRYIVFHAMKCRKQLRDSLNYRR
jgi:hypothetical protein